MIEIAPKELHLAFLWDEAWLYCITLTHDNKHDWRMPIETDATYNRCIVESWIDYDHDIPTTVGNSRINEFLKFERMLVVPVRDI